MIFLYLWVVTTHTSSMEKTHTMDLQKKRVTVLKYVDGTTINEDGILTFVEKTKPIVLNSAKRYYNCLYLLTGLPPLARDLMDYLVEEMNEDNLVYNNVDSRKKFIDFIALITSKDTSIHEEPKIWSDQRVKESFGILAHRGLLIPKSRGTYKVNPEYFFVGSDVERLGSIIIEIKNGCEESTFRVTLEPKVK